MKHPKAFYVLVFAEAWDRLSYYAIQAILVLYFIKVFLFSPVKSYSLYGVYATLGFTSPIFGGVISDRLLGRKNAMILGCAAMIIGNLLLSSALLLPNYIGIGLTLFGTALFKPSATSQLGALYDDFPTQKNNAYTIFYMGMNAGAIVGPIAYGLLIKYIGWHIGFLLSAAGLALSLFMIFIRQRQFQAKPSEANSLKAFVYCLIAAVIIIGLVLFPKALNFFLIILALGTIYYIYRIANSYKNRTRIHIIAIVILSLFGLFFYAASIQTGSSITLFINSFVNHTVFGWHIPTVAFLSLEPLWIIITTPFVVKAWSFLNSRQLEPKPAGKLVIGLGLAALSFFIFYFSAICSQQDSSSHWPLFWLVIGNLTLGVGELAIMPAIMTAISESMPESLSSTMMGVWFLAIGFAGYASSLLSKLTIPAHAKANPMSYAHGFATTAIIVLVATCIMLLLMRYVNKLLE